LIDELAVGPERALKDFGLLAGDWPVLFFYGFG
jgi:hypothetical protein